MHSKTCEINASFPFLSALKVYYTGFNQLNAPLLSCPFKVHVKTFGGHQVFTFILTCLFCPISMTLFFFGFSTW